MLGNNYNNWFADATAAADYTSANIASLTTVTRLYRNTMFSSTIPPGLLDSAAGRAAVMRSPTMWWSEAGIVLGCEGNGCCPLNCTHVYGYTTLMERLFPDLAKDMRISDFVRNYDAAQVRCRRCELLVVVVVVFGQTDRQLCTHRIASHRIASHRIELACR